MLPGRPMLFGTTENPQNIGVGSIDELPVISEDMVEQYKEEAEYEIASELKEEAMNEELAYIGHIINQTFYVQIVRI